MPRCLNDLSTTCVTSLSQPGRILGSASRIVTFVPRSLIIDANSQPMAPPPITTAEPGKPVDRQELVARDHELAVDLEAGDRPWHRARREDDRVAGELDVAGLAAGDGHVLVRPQRACAQVGRDLAALQQPDRDPCRAGRSTFCLRAIVTDQSRPGWSASTPNSFAFATCRYVDAVSSSSLAGMQPTCRQVPPTFVVLDHPDVEPGGCAVQGGRITTWTATDDHDVMVLFGHCDRL